MELAQRHPTWRAAQSHAKARPPAPSPRTIHRRRHRYALPRWPKRPALWHHALFRGRLGDLRAACGGRAAHGEEDTHAEDREQTHQLAHPDQAVGMPDDLLFADRAYARLGDWAVHQSL